MPQAATAPRDNETAKEEVSLERELFPDRAYVRQVIKRNRFFIMGLFVLICAMAVFSWFSQINSFGSTIKVVYDPRDSSESILRYPNYPEFEQVAHAFNAKFVDRSFLYQLANELGIFEELKKAEEERPDFIKRIDHIKGKILALFPASWRKPEKEKEQLVQDVIQALRRSFKTTSSDKNYILTLDVMASSPGDAQRIANVAMDLFVRQYLAGEADRIAVMQETYNEYLAGSSPDLTTVKKEAADADKAETSKEAKLKAQESDLIDRIQMLKVEINDILSQRGQRRTVLEGELNELTARLQPSHPAVIAKKDELQRFSRVDEAAGLRRELNRLRQSLAENRGQQRRLGLAVTYGEGSNVVTTATTHFLPSLTDRVGELSLDRLSMSRQVDNPNSRTRLYTLMPATYEPEPAVNNKMKTSGGLFSLGLILMISLVALREYTSPRARDAWRVIGYTRVPLLTSFSFKQLKKHERVSLDEWEERRQDLVDNQGDESEKQLLTSYRRASHCLLHGCEGNVVLFVEIGHAGATAALLHNLANVHATDILGPTILVDFDYRFPVCPEAAELSHRANIASYLLRQATWDEVCKARSIERAYELAPAPSGYSGTVNKTFSSPIIGKLLPVLGKRYQTVIIRGLNAQGFKENATLLKACTDCILVVDGQSATYQDIKATMRQMDQSKVRGFVMLEG